MSKKVICVSLCALLLALSFPAREQQAASKLYRIGILRSGSPSNYSLQHDAFRKGLRELGYMEGKNLLIEYRYAKSKPERRAEMAAELVRLKVDVIVASPSPSTIRAVRRATRTVPIIVLGLPVDPVAFGFVQNLARPGGNITGLTNLSSKLHAKRLELLKEAFPRISRVAILWPSPQQKQAMKEVQAAGRALGIKIQSLVVPQRLGLDGLERAFSAIGQERPDGLLVAGSRTTLAHRGRVIDFAAKRRLPTIYARSLFVNAGGLMSYDSDGLELHRRAATYVDKILKGSKPGDLPVERAEKFELVINLKTAKELGLTIPPEFLLLADKVIK